MGARRVVTVILDAIPTGLVAGVRTGIKSFHDFNKELDVMAVKHTATFNKIANTAGVVGGVLVGAFALAERATMAFDAQMSKVGAVADASAKQLDQLRASALQAGKDTAFTAVQAAQAEEELAKAGVGTADILGGALKGTLNLAAAGSLELADAATIAAQAMVEFGLKGKDVGHIADVLSAGANKSVASVSSLGQALDQVGAVAHNAHFSLDETVGVLAAFSNQGLDGEEAGTALKTALIKLQNPTNKAAELMKHLGINVYDANGQFISASGVAGQLQSALGGVSEQTRNAALATIFGTRAIRGAVVLYNLGAQGVQKWTDAVNASGAASDTSNKKLDNLSGDIHKLGGSLQALAIGATSQANQGLRFLAQGAEHAVNAFADLPGPVQAVTGDIVAVSGALLLATAGYLKIRGAMLKFNETLAATGPLGTKAAGALGSIGKAAGRATIVGAAVIGMVELAKALGGFNNSHAKIVALNIDALATSLQNLAASGKAAGELAKDFGPDLSGLARDMATIAHLPPANLGQTNIHGPLNQFAVNRAQTALIGQQDAFAKAKANIKDLDSALAQVASSGGATQAHLAFADITTALIAQGKTMPEILRMFPQYTKAAGDAAANSTGLAKGMADTNQQLVFMNEGLATAIQRGETLDSVFKALNGGNIDATTTLIDFNQGLVAFAKTLHGSTHSLNLNTKAGQDTVSGFIDMAKKAEAAAQAILDQTGDVDKASAAYNAHITALRGVMLQAGFTAKQIDSLIAQYARMPKVAGTVVYADGIKSVVGGLQQIYTWIGKVNGKSVHIRVDTEHLSTGPIGRTVNRMGGMYTHAAVGSLREAEYAPPVARGARYAWAEPETKGEIFIPKSGNYGRSMSLIRAAAGWYGASVMPRGGGGVTFNVHADAAAFWRFMRLEVQNHGGVAKAF